jgi:hypothetical protein
MTCIDRGKSNNSLNEGFLKTKFRNQLVHTLKHRHSLLLLQKIKITLPTSYHKKGLASNQLDQVCQFFAKIMLSKAEMQPAVSKPVVCGSVILKSTYLSSKTENQSLSKRTYCVECTDSHQVTKVKQRWGWIVLEWETTDGKR